MKPYLLLLPACFVFYAASAGRQDANAQETTNPTQVSAEERLNQVANLLDQLQESGILNAPITQLPKTERPVEPQRRHDAAQNPFNLQHGTASQPAAQRSSAIDLANQLMNRTLGQTGAPNVEVGEETIRIDLGGRSFAVPRRVNQSPTRSADAPTTTNVSEILESLGQNSLDRAVMYQQLGYAISDFAKREYVQAKMRLDGYSDKLTNDGVIAQTYALTLFQLGDFSKAAAAAHDGLRSAKPFDWEKLTSMYADTTDYTTRYEQLQKLALQEPDRVEYRFLLGYHHLMLGHKQHAARELHAVAEKLHDDPVVTRLTAMTQSSPNLPPAPLAR
ncbi:MAG: hypothetical protein AAGG48_15575 [Planctomycetota bacterium]